VRVAHHTIVRSPASAGGEPRSQSKETRRRRAAAEAERAAAGWADAVNAAVAERDAALGAGAKPVADPEGDWAAIAREVMDPQRARG
jgi:hypothetical protein